MLKRRKSSKSDRKYWIDQLDKVFSLYIRLRDSKAYRFRAFKCISCGEVKPFEQMDCGHFIGRANMLLRWDSSNCHGECRACNRLSSSHLLYYRKNLIIKLGTDALEGTTVGACLEGEKRLVLIKKLGTQKVEALEAQKKAYKKWSIDELKEMYCYYAALVLELKNSI